MSENQETSSSGSNDEPMPGSNSQLMPVTTLSDANVSPRQPRNLQDLLKLSTSLHTDHASSQIDPARAQFLKEALGGLTVDLVTELQGKLQLVQQVTDESKELSKYEEVFDEIIDLVENIDLANAFYQIGGLEVMQRLLHHNQVGVQALAANVVATCSRNNPFCQTQSLEDPTFSSLVNIAENQSNINATFQAISAISAIVRDNAKSIEVLQKYKGFVFLNKAIDSGNEKLVIKTAYLISALCDLDSGIKDELIDLGIVEKLISLVKLTSGLAVEHFLRALESVTRDSPRALRQCLNKQFTFYASLEYLVAKSKQDDAYQNIGELATLLQNCLRKQAETILSEDSKSDQMYDLTMCNK